MPLLPVIGVLVVAVTLIGAWRWMIRPEPAIVKQPAVVAQLDDLGTPASALSDPGGVVITHPDCEQPPRCISAIRTWTTAAGDGTTLASLTTDIAAWATRNHLSHPVPWQCGQGMSAFGATGHGPGCVLGLVGTRPRAPVFLAVTFADPGPTMGSIQQDDSATTLARYGRYRLRTITLQVVGPG